MTNGGYLEARKTKPIGLILIVGAHAAALTAIALAPPDTITPITYFNSVVDSIRKPKPPEPDIPLPEPHQSRPTTPTDTERVVDLDIGKGPILTELPRVPDAGPIEPVNLVAEPVFRAATMDPGALGRFQPGYPSALVRAGIEGFATVRVLIGGDGRVKTVELVNATDPAFFEATRLQALRYWRFIPATRDGIAGESWRTMTVKFKLES